MDNSRRVNWPGALFLTITPVMALILSSYHLYHEGFIWQIWVLAAVFYMLTAMSITGGYHRYFAHKSYEARTWVKWFWALFGGAAFQNSIYLWARDHRVHHRFVDTPKDPYSINRGFFWAHIGWMLVDEVEPVPYEPYGRDLLKDPVVRFQHKHYVLLATLVCFVLPTFIGYLLGSWLGGLAIAGFLRVVAVHHMTFFINSWCHYFGTQPYTDDNTARNSLLMAVATFGEGYHNFHHIFANDYRNGVRWYQWDPTKWLIKVLSWLGGAYNLNRTPWSEILKLQMQMEEKYLQQRLALDKWEQFHQQIKSMQNKVEAAHVRFETLKKEYKQLAGQYADLSREKLADIKLQMKMAKIEFLAARKQWQTYYEFLRQTAQVKV